MSGDGLNDIVRVRNGEVCYWPNIGYGRFGAKVTMDRAPRFDSEERFDPRRIRLADIDGSGTTDLIYLAANGVRALLQSIRQLWPAANSSAPSPGGRLQRPSRSSISSARHRLPGVVVAAAGRRPRRCVRRSDGRAEAAPAGQMRNNLGAETRIAYAPSTRFYLPTAAGRPWITRLPFPVQVVERAETLDWIGRNVGHRYAYHHGFRRLRARVPRLRHGREWDTEECRADCPFPTACFRIGCGVMVAPTVIWRMRLQRAFLEARPSPRSTPRNTGRSRLFERRATRPTPRRCAFRIRCCAPTWIRSKSRRPIARSRAVRCGIETYADDDSPIAANPYGVVEQNFTIRCLQHIGVNRRAVFLVTPREKVSCHYERNAGDPRVTHDITLETDTTATSHGRSPSAIPAAPATHRRNHRCPPPRRRCWPTTSRASTSSPPSVSTRTRWTTPPRCPTVTVRRRPRRPTSGK